MLALAGPALADPAASGDDVVPSRPWAWEAPEWPAAGEAPEAVSRLEADAQDEGDWSFRLAVPLYVWWPDIRGTVDLFDKSSIDFDLHHSDVLELIGDDFSGIWFFFGEARWKKFGARMDLVYMGFDHVSLSDENLEPAVGTINVDQDYDVVLLDPSLSYRLIDTDLNLGPLTHFRFGYVLGMRYLYIKMKGRIEDSRIQALNGKRAFDDSENYFEILPLGAEMELGLSKHWLLRSRIMLGGWGWLDAKGGTDGMWDAALGYRFNESWVLEAGVRWFDAKLDGDDIDYELRNMWGPVAALMWEF